MVVLAILAGGREYVGADWAGYKQYYESGHADEKETGSLEPFFELLRYICFEMKLSYGMFCLWVSLISQLTLWKVFKIMNIQNCFLAFLVYLSLFFCNYQFNIVRHGLMASFVLLGLAYMSKGYRKKALLSVIISSGFHAIGLIFIPILFFINMTLSKKWYLIILGISVAMFIVDISGRIIAMFPFLTMIDRVSGYVDADNQEAYKLSVGTIGFMVIATYSVFFKRDEYENNSSFRITANMVLAGVVLFCSLNAFSVIVQRFGNLLNMGVIILLPYLWQEFRKRHVRLIARSLIVIYLALYYPKSWNVPDELGNYSMLPFRTNIVNLF